MRHRARLSGDLAGHRLLIWRIDSFGVTGCRPCQPRGVVDSRCPIPAAADPARTEVAGATEGWGNWLDAWEGYRVAADGYRELDGERVLVLVNRTGRGKTSGLELEQVRTKGAQLFHVRGGRVTRFVTYWEVERALADLGLEE